MFTFEVELNGFCERDNLHLVRLFCFWRFSSIFGVSRDLVTGLLFLWFWSSVETRSSSLCNAGCWSWCWCASCLNYWLWFDGFTTFFFSVVFCEEFLDSELQHRWVSELISYGMVRRIDGGVACCEVFDANVVPQLGNVLQKGKELFVFHRFSGCFLDILVMFHKVGSECLFDNIFVYVWKLGVKSLFDRNIVWHLTI